MVCAAGRGVAGVLALVAGACLDERPAPTDAPCVPSADQSVVCSRIHPSGISDPASGEFHGVLLRQVSYDFAVCQKCHGQDFRGGASNNSCLRCHQQEPTACVTCHLHIAEQGAHAAHLGAATVEQPEVCAECHVVPAQFDAAGHALVSKGVLDLAPAEVRLGALASRQAPSDQPPGYDAATKTCSGVYCHGGRLAESGAAQAAPSWDEQTELACLRCHGMPPPRVVHFEQACERCHPRVGTGDGAIRDPSLHIDAKIDLGPDGQGACDGCHPDVNAEPRHALHLAPSLGLRGPMGCGDCHVLPETAAAAGHIDPPPAEVFPFGFSGLGAARGADPRWEAPRCAGTYCHGNDSEIEWAAGPPQVFCGSCHGVPPSGPSHAPSQTLADCATCHSASVDAFGNIILVGTSTGVTSRHVNGEVDLQ